MQLERFAPAKVNLLLHVGPLGSDGYHPITSLATFADIGDVVRFRLAPEMEFAVEGPFAEVLAAGGDNLVTRARDLVLAAMPDEPKPFRLTLDKRLPIASGLGGGSSDAAATLMLLGEAYEWAWLADADDSDEALAHLAGSLGADTPMCLNALPVIAEGRGDALSFAPLFPDLDAVLVNPLRPSLTGPVYRAYDAGTPGGAEAPDWPETMETPEAVAAFLAGCRNDLEAPAISLQPAIAEVLRALRERPETLFARMSGSGATCFAICASRRDARDLAFALSSFHGDWWVRACRLAGSRP